MSLAPVSRAFGTCLVKEYFKFQGRISEDVRVYAREEVLDSLRILQLKFVFGGLQWDMSPVSFPFEGGGEECLPLLQVYEKGVAVATNRQSVLIEKSDGTGRC